MADITADSIVDHDSIWSKNIIFEAMPTMRFTDDSGAVRINAYTPPPPPEPPDPADNNPTIKLRVAFSEHLRGDHTDIAKGISTYLNDLPRGERERLHLPQTGDIAVIDSQWGETPKQWRTGGRGWQRPPELDSYEQGVVNTARSLVEIVPDHSTTTVIKDLLNVIESLRRPQGNVYSRMMQEYAQSYRKQSYTPPPSQPDPSTLEWYKRLVGSMMGGSVSPQAKKKLAKVGMV